MKKSTGKALRIWSPIMILAGITSIALDAMLVISRFRDPEMSRFIIFLSAILLLACGVLEIAEGIRSILFLNESARGNRIRGRNLKIRSFRRFTLAAIILGLFVLVFSLSNGIVFWQLAALIGAGILIPLINLLCIKSVR